jgi:hypothetical protein
VSAVRPDAVSVDAGGGRVRQFRLDQRESRSWLLDWQGQRYAQAVKGCRGRLGRAAMADAQEECLMIASVSDDTVTALWEYLEDKR